MKRQLLLVSVCCALIAGCAPSPKNNEESSESGKSPVESTEVIDPEKGIGQIKNVTMNNPLDEERIKRGIAIYEMKCAACHRLDDQRVVGPGWKDVTKRRKPEWIMNMVLNVDVMLDQDPEAQKLLELCLTRMPNQNLSVGDARDVLEYMRQNDGEE